MRAPAGTHDAGRASPPPHALPLLAAAELICAQRERLCEDHRAWLRWMAEAYPPHVIATLGDVVSAAPAAAARRLHILSRAAKYHHARFAYARDKERFDAAAVRALCAAQRKLGRAEGRIEADASRAAKEALAVTAAYARKLETLERAVASAALVSLSKA